MAEPTFEGIPTELRIAILLRISELNSFYNLILASPAYYQTYLCAQTSILRSLIFWQYRHVHITEAVAAISTEGLPAHDERNVDIVEDLLNQRRINLNLTNESLLLKLQPTPAEDYIELFQLYREFHYVLQLFCRTAPCPPWMESNKWQNEVLPLQLSDVEKARVLRALYRLQTYCNVYGPNVQYDPNPPKRKKPVMSRDTDKQPMTRRWRIVDYPEMWRTLFSTMPPWELDELICIWKWARTPYVGIFAEIADDVSEHGPRCKGVNPGLLPHETFELYPDDPAYDLYINTVTELGPRFLYRVLHETYENRRQFIAESVACCIDDSSDAFWNWGEPWDPFPHADNYSQHEQDFESYLASLPPSERPNLSYIRFCYGDGPVDEVLEEDWFEWPGVGACEGWSWCSTIWDDQRLLDWESGTSQRAFNR